MAKIISFGLKESAIPPLETPVAAKRQLKQHQAVCRDAYGSCGGRKGAMAHRSKSYPNGIPGDIPPSPRTSLLKKGVGGTSFVGKRSEGVLSPEAEAAAKANKTAFN